MNSVTRRRLAAQRQKRPASAEKSVFWPRKKKSSRTCPKRRKLQRSEFNVKLNIRFYIFLLIKLDKRDFLFVLDGIIDLMETEKL